MAPENLIGSIWMHARRMTWYRITMVAMMQSKDRSFDYNPIVIYQADDGSLWARTASEFFDGRFTHCPETAWPREL